MTDYTKPLYDPCRAWIKRARKHNKSWSSIQYPKGSRDLFLSEFLDKKVEEEFWPQMDISDWKNIVSSEMAAEMRYLNFSKSNSTLVDGDSDNETEIPLAPESSWQLYKSHLKDSGFSLESIEEIELATHATMRRLDINTMGKPPVKGLVIGHVQSGKTANMAALMAMAADHGWNFFIILSGSIENLRKQTQKRLLNDLNQPGTLTWVGLEHLAKNSAEVSKLQQLHVQDGSNQRYFTVCLKNGTRLTNLLEWMHADPKKMKQLKVIVIDDEADQASVNTADISRDERTRINQLIVNLVEGKNAKGLSVDYQVGAMNYISYTATPYSNFLNEALPESLYPKNFIRSLNPSNEHFGPRQIFGSGLTEETDGLDIIRIVDETEVKAVKGNNLSIDEMPPSLKEAVLWFLCCTAAMRLWQYKKPVSMLIHTGQRQGDHQIMADLISDWIRNTPENIVVEGCRKLWAYEMSRFTKASFRSAYPDYGRSDEIIPDYPSFNEIESGIRHLVKSISSIPLDDDNDLQYTEHIHLCIDNCSKNGISDDGEYVRLAYPDTAMPFATAFIIVGGNTLSRGLTIEGLVSTYFLRASTQADSLMQMGRWFGYRRGYELLPRIWMPTDTLKKFVFLTQLEDDLRLDLQRFSIAGARPTEFGPRVNNSPKVSWMRITAKNKMQGAKETDFDFSGTSTQLILFPNDQPALHRNIQVTEAFLQTLGSGEPSIMENAFVWRNVDFSVIRDRLLKKMEFSQRAALFNIQEPFFEWVKAFTDDGFIGKWNVVVAGAGKIHLPLENPWNFGNGTVGKINRSRKVTQLDSDVINLGVLRAPNDLAADIYKDNLPEGESIPPTSTLSITKVDELRNASGLSNVPQLLIYRVDKNSSYRGASHGREDLNAVEDLIGLNIYIPGSRDSESPGKKLTVNLDDINVPSDEWREES